MSESETALIERCQGGDKEAFGHLVKRYAGPATGSAYLMLGCREEALDASQEAFVRAWRHIRRFRRSSPFYPWYCAILRNVCISRLRRRKPRVALRDDHPEPDAASDPAVAAEQDERRRRVREGILKLPLHHRDIIVMSHFQGLSYKEMAQALEIPIGTVMSRLHNARQALRKLLAGDEQ